MPDYDQLMLMPAAVEDWVGPRHPARFIREFVAALDLVGIGLDTLDRTEGGKAYEPALLLGAWLYGYTSNIRSSRALERACREQMGLVWLTGNHQPDHNALWRFWHKHRDKIGGLFRQSVKVAVEMDLVGFAVQAVDGTKIAAASSGRGGFNQTHLEKLLARLEEQIAEQERQIAAAADGGAAEELPSLVGRREQVRAALARVQAGEAKHAHPLEPEAARMPCDTGNRFGYNAQAVVDAKAQIIVATDLTNAPHDTGQLVPMISAASANGEAAARPLTLADGGFASAAQLAAADQCGYPVVTPPPAGWRDTSNPYHVAHFQHDAQRKVVVCPQGRELPYKSLRQKDGRPVEVYRNHRACRDCPVRALCTQDRKGRTIYIGRDHAFVVQAHRLWQQPHIQELYGLRAPTVEPVFGHIKQQMGFRRWTVRGLDKVRSQWAMIATARNLRVMLRHWSGESGGGSQINFPTPSGPRPFTPACGGGLRALGRNFSARFLGPILPSLAAAA